MEKLLEKLNKLSLPAVILIASLILGGFFYASQVNKQRSIERQQEIKIEQEKQAKKEAQQALNTCITNATVNYSDRWYRECKAQGKLTSKCIDINELSFDEYLKKYNLTIEEYTRERNLTPDPRMRDLIPRDPDDPYSVVWITASFDYIKRASEECSCRLLASTADRFNEGLEKDKAECFKRYPQN